MKNLLFIFLLFAGFANGAEDNVFSNALKRFEVEDLKAVSIKKAPITELFYAFVLDPDGYIHRVEVGDHFGKDIGRIRKIDSCGIWFYEAREVKEKEWGTVHRVMFSEDALHACKKDLPKDVIPVNREASKLADKKQAEKSALKMFFDSNGFESDGRHTPPMPKIYSFSFDNGWIVIMWDSRKENQEIFKIYVLNKKGRVVKFETNGPQPER
jgi:hypothetical protein